MKRKNQSSRNQPARRGPRDLSLPVSEEVLARRREEILETLFPEGIDKNKIWNALVVIFKEEHHSLSGDVLEAVAKCKLGIKKRIKKFFPEITDQWYIISWGDTDLLRRVTQRAWSFSHSHAKHSNDTIVLHGSNSEEFLLDWAAQAVVTMMLRHIKASV